MPTLVKIKATAGDSLCSLAVNAGLLNCAPLRALPENGAFLEKALKGGEEITIPGLHQAFAEKSAEVKPANRLVIVPFLSALCTDPPIGNTSRISRCPN